MVGRVFLRRNKGHIGLNYICKREKMIASLRTSSYFVALIFFTSSLFAQPSVDAGKTTFRNYCASCHSKDMVTKSTGPALAGAQERWGDYPLEDLYGWIRNSAKMINVVKHPRAIAVWEENNKAVMTAFPNLTDDDIASLLLYIDYQVANPPGGGGGDVASTAVGSGAKQQGQYNWLYWVLFGLLGALALILTKTINSLDEVVASKEGTTLVRQPLLKRIFSKRNISFMVFALIVIGGYNTVNNAIALGRQQNYQPDQPIKFSHETHAGVNQIDCQYCHDGARRSKHSVIPAANTCMNCHSAIQVGSKYGTAELTKIYASVGYDPSTGAYIDGYESLKEEEIKDIYTKWIGDSYLDANSLNALDKKGNKLVDEQWAGIVSSLTNEQKKEIPGPIEWIRIHNLPDHVYFNHAQHVTVGQVECQDCHGKVEEMEVVSQHAPLSMGWCINCHRQTEVKFQDNDYYASYEAYHEQLSDGKKEKVTVEDIGGLECQKCHY